MIYFFRSTHIQEIVFPVKSSYSLIFYPNLNQMCKYCKKNLKTNANEHKKKIQAFGETRFKCLDFGFERL